MVPDRRRIRIDKAMAESYGEYMKMTIEDRAIPSVIDGLKPSQRRTMFALKELGGEKFFKSARVCGDVSGKFHPHGETIVYTTVVRMVRDFVNSCCIIDGQGNFGSSEYGAAAARYTEVRLSDYAKEFFTYFDERYSPMSLNYDGSMLEPQVFCPTVPNLLINGCQGIAVGIRTNIPTHNIKECLAALIHLLENPMANLDDILQFIKGPDLPTGGSLTSKQSIRNFYETGEGSMEVRARYRVEDKNVIVFYELPYQTNKSDLVKNLAMLCEPKEGVIKGVSYVRDESGSEGNRIAVYTESHFDPTVIANQIYAHTRFKYTMPLAFYALDEYKSPRLYSLMGYLRSVLKHRENALIAKSIYLLEKSKKRLHVLIGQNVAFSFLPEIMKLIEEGTPEEVKQALLSKEFVCDSALKEYLASVYIHTDKYKLSEEQVKSILDLRLGSLMKLERDAICRETENIRLGIVNLNERLNNSDIRRQILLDEYKELLAKYDIDRRSEIVEFDVDTTDLSMVNPMNVMVLITNDNYIKLVDLNDYRVQNRGGKGRYTANSVKNTLLSNTRNKILFFMSSGKVYCKYVYQIPFGSHESNGRAIVNLLPDITPEDNVVGIFSYDSDSDLVNLSAVFVFDNGNVRRNYMSDFSRIRSNGKKYLKDSFKDSEVKLVSVLVSSSIIVKEDANNLNTADDAMSADEIYEMDPVSANNEKVVDEPHVDTANDRDLSGENIFMATREGMAVCIPVEYFSLIKTASSMGVKGCSVKKGDKVVSALTVREDEYILTVTSKGYGRVSKVSAYRVTRRGAVGVRNLAKNKQKSGHVVACVKIPEELLKNKAVVALMTKEGKAIMVDITNDEGNVPVGGRAGIGRILSKLNEGDFVMYAMLVNQDL